MNSSTPLLAMRDEILRRVGSRLSLLLFSLLLLLTSTAWQTASAVQIIYVAADAPGGGNGAAWSSAYNNLTTAITAAAPTEANPVEIWIKRGVYKPTTGADKNASFILKSHLTLRGGFAGSEATAALRVANTSSNTILSGDLGTPDAGAIVANTALADFSLVTDVDQASAAVKDNSYNVLRASNVSNITLDRLVITGGAALSEGIEQAYIESMIQLGAGESGYLMDLSSEVTGGGLFSVNSSINITDCAFARNVSRGLGGGIVSRNGSLGIQSTSFVRNSSGLAGGAIAAQDVNAAVNGNTLYGNSSGHLAGALLIQSSLGHPNARAYINQVLMSLNSGTYAAQQLANLPAPIDPKSPLSYYKLASSSFKIGKTIAQTALASSNTLATSGSAIGTTAASQATKLLGAQLGSTVTSLGTGYSVISLGVAAVDVGVQLALILGANPNDPFIQTWTQISTVFNTYFTPFGLAKLLINAVLGEEPIDHNRIATALRNADFVERQNTDAAQNFTGNRFELNSAAGMGGGMVVVRTNLNLQRSTFINNEANVGGGAAASFGYNNFNVENSAFTGNRSALGHSALSVAARSMLRSVNNAFVDNHATAANGRALSVETGAEAFIGNSVFWNNTAGEAKTVGADLFVARRVDLDSGAQKAHDDAGDARGAMIGICIIRHSNIQSLASLPLGTELFTNASMYGRPNGFETADGSPNIGEGIGPSAIASSSNFSRDPIFTTGVLIHPLSPMVNAGGENITFRGNDSNYDLAGSERRIGRIDIGPIESDGNFGAGTILYVDASRPASGDGLTWATAYKTITEAAAQPLAPGSQIWVAHGSYLPTSGSDRDATIHLRAGVALIGGFKSGDARMDQSSPVAQATILSGDIGAATSDENSRTLLTGTSVAERSGVIDYERVLSIPRLIQGMSFTGAQGGPAVRVASPVVIRNCYFHFNNGPDRALAIIPSTNSRLNSAQIFDSSFRNNTGGAIDSSVFNLDVVRSEFHHNTAPLGAAIYLHGPSHARQGNTRIERSVFAHNAATSGRGGAVFYDGRSLTVAHSVFANNTATPAADDSSAFGGAALWLPYQVDPNDRARVVITNSIFHGNRLTGSFPETTVERQQLGLPSYPAYMKVPFPILTNNNIEGLDQFATTSGNVDYDPFFTFDYRLAADSMLLNRGAGYASGSDTTVIAGAADIGAFENPTVTVARPIAPLNFTALTPTESGRTFTFNLPNGSEGKSNFVWEVKRNAGGAYVSVTEDSHTSGLGSATLTLTNPPHTWNDSLYRVRFLDSDSLRSISASATAVLPPSFLYVKSGGSGSQDGSSWENAMASPAPALAIATAHTQVFVAAGDYTMAPSGLQPGVKLYGGFAGTETAASQRVAGANETILRSTTPFAATISSGGTAATGTVIDGFTVKGAAGGSGGTCIGLSDANTSISNVRFQFAGIRHSAIHQVRGTLLLSNSEFTDGSEAMVFISSGTAQVSHCVFTNNGLTRVGQRAGAISAEGGSSLIVSDSSFTNNFGRNAGAIDHQLNGRYNPIGGVLSIERCRFIENSGGGAGVIAANSPGSHVIRNSLFARNHAIRIPGFSIGSGGAINLSRDANFSVVHCTLVGNIADANGGAISGSTRGSYSVTNSIVWGNSGVPLDGVGAITNSHVQGSAAFAPLLDDASADYALALGSPLINAGGSNTTLSGGTDLNGLSRFHETAADLGASEFAAASPVPVYVRTSPADQSVFVERPVSFSIDASITTNTGSTPIIWEYFDGSSWLPVSGVDGWTVSIAGGLSTLSHPAVTQPMDGMKIRATLTAAPGVAIPATLTVKPRIVLFVDSRIAQSGNGKSWTAAYQTIAEAFAAANGDTDIWIATGEYTEANLTTPFEARVYLGFAGNETLESQRDPVANPIRIGSPLADIILTVNDVVTFVPPLAPTSSQQGRWQVDRGDGAGFVDLSADAWHTLTLVNGIPGLTILGNTDFANYQYRLVISENGSEVFSSLPAQVTVIARPVVYVDASVSGGSQDGSSWENAFGDLSAALAAHPAFADLKVAQGTYVAPANGSFFLRRSLTLTGGYLAGTETRDPAVYRTILQSPGSATSYATTLGTAANRGSIDSLAIIDGFVFRNAGLGINLRAASPVIRNCRFEALVAAIAIADGNPNIENSVFVDQLDTAITTKGNTLLTVSGSRFERNGAGIPGRTVAYGSAIVIGQHAVAGANNTQAAAVVTDTTFFNNFSQYGGPVITVSSAASLQVVRCRFTGNSQGAILASNSSRLTVRQSLIDNNQGGAIHSAGSLEMAFSTIAFNDSSNAAILNTGSAVIRDSILWGNTRSGKSPVEAYQINPYEGSRTLSRNIIQGLNILTGTQLVPFDPRFVDVANGDFRLAPDSPAIDMGLASGLLANETDLAGAPRTSDSAPDLGAFEATSSSAPDFGLGLPASLAGPVGSDLGLSYTAPRGSSVVWQFSSDGIAWSSINPTGGSASSPPGATASVQSLSQLTLASIQPALDGISIRMVLTIGGTTYTSPTVPIAILPFEKIYVDASVPASGDGLTWGTAFKTLSEALASADAVHRILEVAEGTYRPAATAPDLGSFRLAGFDLRGGWPSGGNGPRDPAAHPTILSGMPDGGGSRAEVIVRITSGGLFPASLDGVTVENGATGIRVDFIAPQLTNLIVRGNTATGLIVNAGYNTSGGRVENSVFENNTGVDGGGIHISGGSPALERLTLRGNTATGKGGGMYIDGANTISTSLLISGNLADIGGGVYSAGTNCFDQTTIAGNRARSGAAINGIGRAPLRNSIVWGNRSSEGAQLTSGESRFADTYAMDVFASSSRTVVEETTLTNGILRYDPVLVSAVAASAAPTVAGDYRLRNVSPAINAGDNSVVSGLTLDVAGQPRLVGDVDLGAYESSDSAGTPLLVTSQPSDLTYRRDLVGNQFSVAGSGAASIHWEYAAPGGEWVSLVGVAGFSGADSATLTVSSLLPGLNGYRVRAVLTSADGSVVYSDAKTLTVYSPRYHVNVARPGSDPGDGLSWATAFRSLDAALALPYDVEGTEIWVAAGTYTPATSFVLRPRVSLFGGFAADETLLSQRDPAAHVTALTGANGSAAIVRIPFVNVTMRPVRIDGFTLRDASGSGIEYNANFPLNIDGVIFTNLGTALSQYSGTATITACRFTGNQCAIFSRVSGLVLSHSEFRGNGGNGSPVINIPQSGQTQTIENCLFSGNATTPIFTRGSTTLRHVSIVNNLGGTALDAGTVTLHNSIVWGNRSAGSATVPTQVSGTLFGVGNAFEGVTAAEPVFVDPVPATSTLAGNYQLTGTSRVIESGINAESNIAGLDLAGSPRLRGARVDPGAYEYQEDPYFITSPANAVATHGSSAQFTVAATAAVQSYAWDQSSDGSNWTPLTDGPAFSGSGTASLTVTGDASFAGRLFRARLQFPGGPELASDAARFDFISVDSATTGGFATPAVFTASASGSVTAWQWEFSVNGGSFAAVSNDANHSGATTNVLTVAGNSSFTNRVYRVRVSYADSPTTSSNGLAYSYAELATTPAEVARHGTLAYGSSRFGFAFPGLDPATLTDASVAAHARFSGRAGLGAAVIDGDQVDFDFTEPLHAGEAVTVTTTSALTADGISSRPQVWQFVHGVRSGTGIFDQATPVSGSNATAFALGDLDGDVNASIDTLVSGPDGNQIYLNDGRGQFTATGSPFGNANATAIALGSFTSAGGLDAAVANADGSIEIWTNDGTGVFTFAQTIANASARTLALGDLDADGDLDLFVARSGGNRIFLNNGSGNFTATGNVFGGNTGVSIALSDVNNDGQLDALVAAGTTSALWINQGNGVFAPSIQSFANRAADRVAIADFNSDGLPDLVFTRANAPTQVWRNQGNNTFIAASTALGGGTATLATGDTNGDGSPDLVLTDATGAVRAWSGSDFIRTENQPALAFGDRVELADLDGDGALDLFGLDPSGQPASSLYRVVESIGNEDEPLPLASAGFTRDGGDDITHVRIASLPATGSLLDGSAPVSTGDTFTLAEAASLTYQPEADFYGFDSFTWLASTDGANFTPDPLSYWLIIVPQADEVVPVADAIALLQGGSATMLVGGDTSVLANDVNADPGTYLAASIVGRPANGTLTLNAEGSFIYQHNNSETRSDTFTYRATNTTSGRFADAVVTITINNVNDAPSSVDFAVGGTLYTGQPAGATAGTLTASDPDPEDAGQLVLSLVSNSDDNAQFAIEGDVLKTAVSLDAAAGLTRSVRIRATDPSGLFVEKVVALDLTPPPAALAASFTTDEDNSVATPLTGENGAGALSYEIVQQPAHGSLSGSGANYAYHPNLDFNGSDSFTFRVSDGVITSAPATVSLTVLPVNDAPTLAYTELPDTDDNTPASVTLSGYDLDGDALQYWVEAQGSHGSASITGSTLTYTPTSNQIIDPTYDWVIVYAYDPVGLKSMTRSIRVLITPENDAPILKSVAPSSAFNSLKGVPVSFSATVTDPDSTPTLQLGTPPQHGTVEIRPDHTFTYTHTPGFTGADSFSVIATDGEFYSSPVTIQLSINDPAPVANNTSATGDQRSTIKTFLSGSDPQGDALTATIVIGPAHGSVRLVPFPVSGFALANYEAFYTPNPDFSGTDSVTFTMTDEGGNVSEPATATFTVNEVNLAPEALSVSLSQSGLLPSMELTLSGSDEENAPLTYRIVTPPSNGTLVGSGPGFTYTPAASPYEGTDSFTYVVNDGVQDSPAATVSLTFTNDHPDPVAMMDSGTVYRGLYAEIDVLANDFDPWNNPLFISEVTQGTHGTVSRNGQRLVYQHNGDAATEDSFTYTLSNFNVTVVQTVQVSISDRIIHVTSNADSGPDTLRDAVETVNLLATVAAAPDFNSIPSWIIQLHINQGTSFALDTVGDADASRGDSALLLKGKVTLQGSSFTPITLRRADYADPMRVLRIAAGAEVTLKDLNFENGIACQGGGIYNEGTLALENVTFAGNSAQPFENDPGLGGGLFNRNATLTLDDVRFTGNTADDAAGFYNLADGFFTPAQVIANKVAFTGQAPATDFRSVGVNGGNASIVAGDFTAEIPTAPWFGPIADTTIRSRFSETVPALLDAGQFLTFLPDFTTNGHRTVTVTGKGDSRTITAVFDDTTPQGVHPVDITAGGNGSSFMRRMDLTLDSNSDRPPVLRDDYIAAAFYEPISLTELALANDEDPDGTPMFSIFIPTQSFAGEMNYINGQQIFRFYGDTSLTYTYPGALAPATIFIKVQTRTMDITSASDDSAPGSLREGIDFSNTYPDQAWSFHPSGLADPVVEITTVGENDPDTGDSAFLITGDVTIDGANQPGFVLRRGDSAPAMRLFRILPGATLTLRNLTLENGISPSGGAIYNEGTLVLDHVKLQGSTASASDTVPGLGGAIYNNAGSVTITASELLANTARSTSDELLPGLGGAIYTRNGTVTLAGSSVLENSAGDAGALFAEANSGTADIHITDSRIGDSYASSDVSSRSDSGGQVTFYRRNSNINRITGPWISPLPDLVMATADTLNFLVNDEIPDLTLTATSEIQAIVPNSGLAITGSGLARQLTVAGDKSGITLVHVIASSGNVSFHEIFRVAADTGVITHPTVYPDVAEIYTTQTAIIDVLANDSDPYGLNLTITSVTKPAHGTATITEDGKISYTHTGRGDPGTDEFFYTVSNGFGGTATTGTQIQFKSRNFTVTNSYQLSQTLDLVNTYPDLSWTIIIAAAENQSWSSPGYVTDDEYYTGFHIMSHVTIDASGSSGFSFLAPPGGYSGPPTRIFSVYPGASLSLKNLRLTGGDPQSFGDGGVGGAVRNRGHFTADYVVFESNRASTGNALGGALYNDGGTVVLTHSHFQNNSVSGETAKGGAIASRNGSLTLDWVTFSGNSAEVGNDLYLFGDAATATLRVRNGEVPSYELATLNDGELDVSGLINTAPAFPGFSQMTAYETPAAIPITTVLASATDAEGDVVSFVGIGTSANGGTVTVLGTHIIYTPPAGFTGIDTFPITFTDSRGTTGTGPVSVNVQPSTGTDDVGANAPELTVLPNRRILLRIQGIPGRSYLVQRSLDLITWDILTTLTAGETGRMEFTDESPTSSGFYRLARP